MKNTFISFFIFLVPFLTFSQNGVITYNQIDSFGQPSILKMSFNKNYTYQNANVGIKGKKNFLANGEEVDYKNKAKVYEQLSRSNKIYTYYFDEEGDVVYKNLKTDTLIVRLVNHQDPVISIENKIPNLNWTLKKEFKTLGNFKCQKAIVNFRGRQYEAWFTPKFRLMGVLGSYKVCQD